MHREEIRMLSVYALTTAKWEVQTNAKEAGGSLTLVDIMLWASTSKRCVNSETYSILSLFLT